MPFKLTLCFAITLLAGCAGAGAPNIKMATPLTVMIENVDKYDAAEALQLAESECQKHGKHAIHIPDSQRDGIASYECKE